MFLLDQWIEALPHTQYGVSQWIVCLGLFQEKSNVTLRVNINSAKCMSKI